MSWIDFLLAGPKPLPVIGCFWVYKGAQGALAYNFAHNVFAPEKRAVWGDTVLVVLPNSAGPEGERLKVGCYNVGYNMLYYHGTQPGENSRSHQEMRSNSSSSSSSSCTAVAESSAALV
jgi:hypothetical protein